MYVLVLDILESSLFDLYVNKIICLVEYRGQISWQLQYVWCVLQTQNLSLTQHSKIMQTILSLMNLRRTLQSIIPIPPSLFSLMWRVSREAGWNEVTHYMPEK